MLESAPIDYASGENLIVKSDDGCGGNISADCKWSVVVKARLPAVIRGQKYRKSSLKKMCESEL